MRGRDKQHKDDDRQRDAATARGLPPQRAERARNAPPEQAERPQDVATPAAGAAHRSVLFDVISIAPGRLIEVVVARDASVPFEPPVGDPPPTGKRKPAERKVGVATDQDKDSDDEDIDRQLQEDLLRFLGK